MLPRYISGIRMDILKLMRGRRNPTYFSHIYYEGERVVMELDLLQGQRVKITVEDITSEVE